MNPKTTLQVALVLAASAVGLLIRQGTSPLAKGEPDPSPPPPPTSERSAGKRDAATGEDSGLAEPEATAEETTLASLSDTPMDSERRQAWLRAMAWSNPEGAVAWVEQLRNVNECNEATRDLALFWSEANLEAALAWLQKLPDDSCREMALGSICAQLGGKDAPAALALAETLDLGSQKASLVENLTAQWAARDAKAAVAWAKGRSDPQERGRLLGRLAFALAKVSPAKAAILVVTEMPDGPERGRAAVSIVYQWAQRDPKAAGEWVKAFPEGPLRTEAASNLIGIWGERDDADAAQWVSTLSNSSTYDAAKAVLAQARARVAASAHAATKEVENSDPTGRN